MIDIKDLEAFASILDSGSISKAAKDLGLTQPALSLKLKKMESELGVKLFERTSRNVIPLESARVIEPKIRDILSKFDGVREALALSIKDLTGQVRVGCLTGWFDTLMVPLVETAQAETPRIKLKLKSGLTDQLLFMLTHGQLDFAIVAAPFENHGGSIETLRLLDEGLTLIGKDLPSQAHLSAFKQEILKRPWIAMESPDPLVDKFWRKHFDGELFPWDQVYAPIIIDNILSIPRMVAKIPRSVAVIPRQIMDQVPSEFGLQLTSTIPHRNGLFLAWRQESMELERFKYIKEIIIKSATTYLKNVAWNSRDNQ